MRCPKVPRRALIIMPVVVSPLESDVRARRWQPLKSAQRLHIHNGISNVHPGSHASSISNSKNDKPVCQHKTRRLQVFNNSTHPYPRIAIMVAMLFVATNPSVSIDGSTTAVTGARMIARKALQNCSVWSLPPGLNPTHVTAAITSALRDCSTSTLYEPIGVRTKSTCRICEV